MSWNDISVESKLKRYKTFKQNYKLGLFSIHNTIPREYRTCVCGCENKFSCRIDSKQRFIHGHNGRKTTETRTCLCGCGQMFTCKVTSPQKYAGRGHATRDKNNVAVQKQRKKQSIKMKGKDTWNKGLTKEDPRVAKNVIGFQRLNKERTGKHTDRFGKTYEELYGDVKATQLKNDCSNRMKNLYDSFDDEQKAEYLRNTLWKAGRHPNKFEDKCGALLNIYYPNEFEYCGNGKSVIINGRNPDFIHKTKKIVILCNGTYWHIKKIGYEDTIENRHTIELIESKAFRAYGYEVWIIWEDKVSLNKVVILNREEVGKVS